MKLREKVYVPGDIRMKEKFLWFPKSLLTADREYQETRWLEKSAWTQVFYSLDGWVDYEWVGLEDG